MVTRADVVLEWADGEYLFALRGREIENLEAECMNPETGKKGIGIGSVWGRVMGSAWYRSDIMGIIRHGLIGGGMGPVEAKRLVEGYAEGIPLSTLDQSSTGPNCPLTVARAILAAAFVGVTKEDSSGEKETPES